MKIQDKRILITGGYGLAGTALHNTLQQNGYEKVYRFHSKDYDLTKQLDAERILSLIRPQVVFHLAAAVGGIWANKTIPASFVRANTLMNINLLEACAQTPTVEKVCLIGSGCVYPQDAPLPLKESDMWGGLPEPNTAPYGLTKRMLVLQSQAYRTQYGLNSFVVMPTNLYGEQDNFDPEHSHVIPGIVRKIDDAITHNKEEVVLWGDGSPTRDFLYIEDFANILIRLTKSDKTIGVVNAGSGEETSIALVANLVSDIMGFKGQIIWDSTRPNGQQRRYFDISYLREIIKDYDFCSLKDGLAQTIRWYNNNKDIIRLEKK